jgi:hypothetical protein
MNLTKVNRNDWIVIGGFLLAFIGTLGAWYTVSIRGFGGGSVNGWHGAYLGWLVFLLCLAAAGLSLSRALNLSLPLPAGLAILVCGALSALFVFIRLLILPGIGISGLAASAVGIHVGRGWGIWLTFVAALIVTVGGLLKNAEPAG